MFIILYFAHLLNKYLTFEKEIAIFFAHLIKIFVTLQHRL